MKKLKYVQKNLCTNNNIQCSFLYQSSALHVAHCLSQVFISP